jgi:putative hydrolase of the HAD superfamily
MIGSVPYRAVFFDAGETLVHPHPTFPELLALTLQEEGLQIDPARIREKLHVVADRFAQSAEAGELWSTSAERSREFWASVYGQLLASLGLPLTGVVARRLYSTFTDLSNYRLFPDVEQTLGRLRTAGLVLGVVSNFEEWLERLLEVLGVTPFLDVRVISGVEGVEKPDPKIFRLALDRTGVEPELAVYVGDSVTFDVEPAAAVGMFAVLIDRRGRFPRHAGPRISSLAELPPLIGVSG